MDQVLCPNAAYVATYLDDVIIHSDTWVEHVQWVAAVLESLKQMGLTDKPKCSVGRREVQYLRYHLGGGRVIWFGGQSSARWRTCRYRRLSV